MVIVWLCTALSGGILVKLESLQCTYQCYPYHTQYGEGGEFDMLKSLNLYNRGDPQSQLPQSPPPPQGT